MFALIALLWHFWFDNREFIFCLFFPSPMREGKFRRFFCMETETAWGMGLRKPSGTFHI
jgi:hypothetical protein